MLGVQAYCHPNAATMVTIPYGMSIVVRTVPRPKIVRYMSSASSMPSTSSTATDAAVMTIVTVSACHQNGELSTAP